MYCELTLPGRIKVPGRMRPLVLSGKPPRPCRSQPAAMISSESGERGRAPRRPWPTKVASAPSAQATGSIKRSVEPLSPQSSVPPGKCLEQAKLNALHGGVDLEAVLDGLDARAQGREAAYRGLDIGAGGIAGHMRLSVGAAQRDDEAVRHRLGCDSGNGALEREGVMRASQRMWLPSGRGPRQLNHGRWKAACGRCCSGQCRAESPGR